jgi:DNA polymerase I-like protein with 3'-5' exonuclease and polymerase domains
LGWLHAKGIKSAVAFFDTFTAAHLLDENRSNSLKSLARTYLGAGAYDADISFDYAQPIGRLATYNGRDVDYTLRLYRDVIRPALLEDKGLLRIFKHVSMRAVNSFCDVELVGFPVDMERLETRHQEILDHIERVETELCEWVPQEVLDRGRPNFRSPIFLGDWLFNQLKLPVLEIGAKSGRPSTREAVLLQLKRRHPALEKLMELRKWMKYESTYTRNWLERVSVAGRPRIFTSYNLGGTVTGRLSSNMQQVPRDVYIRGIIGAPKGWKLIEADFSQVELRLAGVFAKDPELIKIFNEGRDPHMEMAIDVTHRKREDIDKETRKLAKSINFGFLYGMGPNKFIQYCEEKYDIKITKDQAVAYRDAFFRKYPALSSWHYRTRERVQARGYVRSPLGRVRHLPTVRSGDEAVVAEAERQAINSPVQGMASDLAVLSMGLLHEKLDRRVARVLGNLHDAVILEVRADRAEQTAETVRSVMEDLPLHRLFGFRSPIPFKVDVAVVDHWGGV